MKLWLKALALGSVLLAGHGVAATSYQVKNLDQFVVLMEKINLKHANALKKFLAGLDPNTAQLNAAQLAEYCQLMQQRIDESYLSYDSNRQLFNGQGAGLSKQDFINKIESDLTVQALKSQGVSCQY